MGFEHALFGCFILVLLMSTLPDGFGQSDLLGFPSIDIPPEADTYVDPFMRNFNFGASENLKVNLLLNYSYTQSAYLKFDLSSIPNGTRVHEARLFLYLKEKSTDITSRVGVHRVPDSAWHELRLTYANAPKFENSPVYVNDTVGFTDTWHYWVVTDEVIRSLPNGKVMFALVGENATGTDVFASKDSRNPEERPYLRVIYGSLDEAAPTISEVRASPQTPSSEDEVTISARVADADTGLSSVFLYYQANNTEGRGVKMEPHQGTGFTGLIPRQRSNVTVEYYVEALDNAGNRAASDTYSYVVDRPPYYHSLLSQYEALESSHDELQARFEDLLSTYSVLIGNHTDLLKSYGDLEVAFKSLRDIYDSLRSRADKVENLYSGLQSELRSAKSSSEDLKARLDELKLAYEQAQHNADASANDAKLYSYLIMAMGGGLAVLAFFTVKRRRP